MTIEHTWANKDTIHSLMYRLPQQPAVDPGFGQGGPQHWSAQFCRHSGAESCK